MEDNYWMRRRRLTRRGFIRGMGVAAGVAALAPALAGCGSNSNKNNKTTPVSKTTSGAAATSAAVSSSAAATSAAVAPSAAPATEARKASAPGVTADTITLGATFALSGPYSSYDPALQVIKAVLQKTNEAGGVNGRQITWQVEDDAYDPAKTVPLAKKLVEQDKVFAMVCCLGTPTNTAIVDYLNQNKAPHLYPVTGANAWGDYKTHPWTVGFLPAYGSEGQVYAKYVAQTWPGKKVGALYQNDDYGKNYYQPFKAALGASNPIVDEETYESTASDVSTQVTNLKAKGAEVFVLIAVPKFGGLALKAAADQNWKPNIILNSVSADPSIFQLAGGPQNLEGVISDGWWADPSGTDPSIQSLKDLITKYTPSTQIATFAVWGYVAGQMIVETLTKAGVNPTRDSLLAAAESFNNFQAQGLLPGVTLSTSKTDHEPIKAFQLNKATSGKFVYFGNIIQGAYSPSG